MTQYWELDFLPLNTLLKPFLEHYYFFLELHVYILEKHADQIK